MSYLESPNATLWQKVTPCLSLTSAHQFNKASFTGLEDLIARHSQLVTDVLTALHKIHKCLPPALVPAPLPAELHSAPQVEPYYLSPQRYPGDPSTCRGFLMLGRVNCSVCSWITDIITLLSGQALEQQPSGRQVTQSVTPMIPLWQSLSEYSTTLSTDYAI